MFIIALPLGIVDRDALALTCIQMYIMSTGERVNNGAHVTSAYRWFCMKRQVKTSLYIALKGDVFLVSRINCSWVELYKHDYSGTHAVLLVPLEGAVHELHGHVLVLIQPLQHELHEPPTHRTTHDYRHFLYQHTSTISSSISISFVITTIGITIHKFRGQGGEIACEK